MRGFRLAVVEWLKAVVAAFQFLTRIPLPFALEYTDKLNRRSVVFYPLAGAVIGGIVLAAGLLLNDWFPAAISAILLAALWTMLSGALHLDGLMDTADGLLSHRSKERMLEIMKDSRVGAMGVIVCVFYLGLKTASLAFLIEEGSAMPLVLIATIPAWSRSFMVAAIAAWPYARPQGGIGSLYRSVRMKHAIASSLGAAFFSAVFLFAYGGWSGTEACAIILVSAAVACGLGAAMASAISRKLGGLTGDVYGALNECIELGLLTALVGYVHNLG
ncbi:adenosylcobinamide-GDP ribazoletransferase [Cohnella faecalis]|uniref:Adenosylcobinamide-GDP ribazoletransferase n=1 Tax=Cohnella faecalis TaxID=2315694 RepID=A0A398CPB0_9BACL|nr:adenosylcobinamide-GDP ribazoletransferase [Cohnella faecalis]RIE04000.1 adenosylcobinamide-GDP ribazoletransferase [Cohnella faecalis]